MRFVVIFAVGVAGAACAKSPESIAPSYISEVAYQIYTCDQLGAETGRLSAALATASAQQNQARSNDMVGVILIGLPVSSMSGDNVAPEIARLKGETEAVRKASMTKRCGSAVPVSAPILRRVGS